MNNSIHTGLFYILAGVTNDGEYVFLAHSEDLAELYFFTEKVIEEQKLDFAALISGTGGGVLLSPNLPAQTHPASNIKM